MTRPLLLGEAFSREPEEGEVLVPLGGAIGARLSEWAGVPIHERFDCRNLYDQAPERWGWFEARQRWLEMLSGGGGWPVIVCLGRPVQIAVSRGQRPWHRFHLAEGFCVVAIPHPSSRNRLLNYRDEQEKCAKTLRAVLGDTIPCS